MSLYLCIYAGDREVEGVEVGPYADFNAFRDAIAAELGGSEAGVPFPTLLTHSDCDGEWPPEDCDRLRRELAAIAAALKKRPDLDFGRFTDVDGEPLVERLQHLADVAVRRKLPILFQ